MPNPPSLPNVPNPQSYTPETISADVVVNDDVTGLVWQQDVPPGEVDWEGATSYCEELMLAGFCDWRLPSRIELVSILDYTRAPPFIDPVAFPETPMASFWSASPVVDIPSLAWGVSFANQFFVYGHSVIDLHRVRCVRGAPGVAQEHYTPGSAGLAGTVLDNETNLRWQQVEAGEGSYFEEFETLCQDATTGGIADWRIPTRGELLTLVDESQANPSIDETLFPGTVNSGYVTSYDGGGTEWWNVVFDYGNFERTLSDATGYGYLRCVH